MPKLKNITEAELEALACGASSDTQCAYDYLRRMEQGYCDKLETPIQLATNFLQASQSLAALASIILTKAQLQEQRAELEKTLRRRSQSEVA